MFSSSLQLCQDWQSNAMLSPPHLGTTVARYTYIQKTKRLRDQKRLQCMKYNMLFMKWWLPVALSRWKEWDSRLWISPFPRSTSVRLTFAHKCSAPIRTHSQSRVTWDFFPNMLSSSSLPEASPGSSWCLSSTLYKASITLTLTCPAITLNENVSQWGRLDVRMCRHVISN